MANDFTTSPGTGGAVFRSLDDGTRHWPAGLVGWGPASGPYNEVDNASGKGLPVQASTGATWVVTNAGTFVTQIDGAALTALQLIDNLPVAVDTALGATPTGSLAIGIRDDALSALTPVEGDAIGLRVDANGALWVIPSGTTVVSGTVAVTGTFWQATQPVSLTSTTITGTVAVTQSGTWDEVGINDSGNSITVDAPVGTPAFVRLSDGSAAITTLAVSLASVPSHAVTNAGTFAVQVDGSALTALQLLDDVVFAEDVAAQAADKGVAILAVRRDADTTLVGADNDYANLQVDANGYLKVEIFDGGASHTVDNNGTFAVQAAQSGAWNIGTVTTVTTVSTVTAVTAITNALPAGTNAIGKLAANSGVDIGDVDVTSVVPGTAATSLGKAEDAAHATADTGVMALAVRSNTAASTSGTDGDYQPLITNTTGHLWVDASGQTLTVGSHAVTNAGTFVVQATLAAETTKVIGTVNIAAAQTLATVTTVGTVTTVSTVTAVTTVSTLTTLTGGGIAHDGADSGNPVKIGAKALTSLASATLVANADRTDAASDLDGALITRPQFPLGDLKSDAISNTDGASTASSVFTAVASTKNYITAIHAFNTSATAGYIDFRDGTGGAVLYRMILPATGGAVLPAGSTPYFKTSANTALAYDVSAALTTVYVNVTGYQSKL